jgi:hypothetical protein
MYLWIISCLIWISGPFPTTKTSKPWAACSCQYICGECADIMATAGIHRCDTGCWECWFLSTQVYPGSSISSISAPAHDGPEQWTWSSKLQWVQHGRAFGFFHYVTYAYLPSECKVARPMNYKHFEMSFPQLVLIDRAVTIGHFLELVDCIDSLCQRIYRAKNVVLNCLVHICGQWFLTLLTAVVTRWWLHIQLICSSTPCLDTAFSVRSLRTHHTVGQFPFAWEWEYVVKTFVSHELGKLWCPESDVNCESV